MRQVITVIIIMPMNWDNIKELSSEMKIKSLVIIFKNLKQVLDSFFKTIELSDLIFRPFSVTPLQVTLRNQI